MSCFINDVVNESLGLICNDEPERTEICLRCAESLIRKQPVGLEEVW